MVSPRKGGNCEQALNFMGEVFNNNGIDFEIVQVGNKMIRGCLALLSLFTDWQ